MIALPVPENGIRGALAPGAAATPEMLPVLLALARARLAPGAVEELEDALAATLAAR